MNRKLIALVITLFLGINQLFAHALWIQTASTGKVGQKQSIKIIYSEPGEGSEKMADWYSDVKDFELWLIGPDKNKVKLSTTAAADSYFTSEFTPEKDGVYTLAVGHTAKDIDGTTVYQFNASALVTVGKAVSGNDASANTNDLNVFVDASKKYKVNQPLQLKGFFKNAPAEKVYVTITAPSGWSRQLVTDANGNVDFVPFWTGTYLIEISNSWKEKGQLQGKDYEAIWRCATTSVDVK